MKIRYTVALDDLIAFNRYHIGNSPAMKRQFHIFYIITPGILLLVFSCIAILEQSLGFFIVGILLAVFLSFGGAIYYRWNLGATVRKLYGEGKNKGVLGEHTLELIEDDIIAKTDVGESRSRISSLERIEASPDHAFFYTSALTAFVVPRNNVLEGDFDLFPQETRKRFDQT